MTRDKRTMRVLLAVGILGSIAIGFWGLRRYRQNAKLAEARDAVSLIAQGVARCSTARGYVPTSNEEAFLCASFSSKAAAHVRYLWLREGDAAGFVRAEVDSDEDGTVDERIELEVACGASGCRAAPGFREPKDTR